MKHFTYLLALLFSCCFLFAEAQQRDAFIVDSLDQYISKGMEDWQIPGLAVAIVKDGKVVHMKGYGTTVDGGDRSVDENTLFMIGSNTKAFTAAALANLHKEGVLSLDDKATKWIPEFRLKDPLASSNVNIRDLLSHRIGFETFQGDFTYWGSTLSREEVMKRMALIDAPYAFRTQWGYCNAAFMVAGEIIPKVTGSSWSAYLTESILKPLGMSRTYCLHDEWSSLSNVAQPHTIIEGQVKKIDIKNIDNLAPAGSMSSSIQDMAIWMKANLSQGKAGDEQVIHPDIFESIRQPHSIMATDTRFGKNSHIYLYGLGLMINDRNNMLVYSHTGGVNGYLSSTTFVPEVDLGVVVLTNTDQNNFFQNLSAEILDAYLGLPYYGYSEESLAYASASEERAKKLEGQYNELVLKASSTVLPLTAYQGVYKNELYGSIEIKSHESHDLCIHFSRHPELMAYLDYAGDHHFRCTFSDPIYGTHLYTFNTDGEAVTDFSLKVAEFIELTTYTFTKQ
jgi:CubicO group peptidase (beta-lactamase class C family)